MSNKLINGSNLLTCNNNKSVNLTIPNSTFDDITDNTTNISTNTSNITTNASNITTNTSNIASNTSNITTNTNNITTNTNNIATNTNNISTNTNNISTNTNDIATNTSNISTNTNNISTNTSNISTNTSNINNKQDTITNSLHFNNNQFGFRADNAGWSVIEQLSNNNLYIKCQNDNTIYFKVNGTSKLEISDNKILGNEDLYINGGIYKNGVELNNFDDTSLQNQITTNSNDIDEIKDGDLEEFSLTKSNFHSKLNLRGSSGNYTGQINFQNWNSSNNEYDIKSMIYHSTDDYLAFYSNNGFKFLSGNVGIGADINSNYNLNAGSINATNIYKNGVELINFDDTNLQNQINTNSSDITDLEDREYFEEAININNGVAVPDGIQIKSSFNQKLTLDDLIINNLNSGFIGLDNDKNVINKPLDELNSLYVNGNSSNYALRVKHNSNNNNCLKIENSYGKWVSVNAGEKNGSSSKRGGLVFINEWGKKHWISISAGQDTKSDGNNQGTLSINYNYSFTGQHLCIMKKEELENIKVGMVVSSINDICNIETGRDWTSKQSITINQAVPVVEICKKVKDKKVYGVFSGVCEIDEEGYTSTGLVGDNFMDFKENIGDNEVRVVINSIGEGAILVVNTAGNIESGDYICSSPISGFCQKQTDDIKHNYTVAKIVINCNFDLDSDLYDCYELDNGVKYAFLAAVYEF